MKKLFLSVLTLGLIATFAACSDSNNGGGKDEPEKELAEDYYTGGKLGTTFNTTSSAYEQFTQAVENQGLLVQAW